MVWRWKEGFDFEEKAEIMKRVIFEQQPNSVITTVFYVTITVFLTILWKLSTAIISSFTSNTN